MQEEKDLKNTFMNSTSKRDLINQSSDIRNTELD